MRISCILLLAIALWTSGCKSRKVAADKPSRLSDLTLREVEQKAAVHHIPFAEISMRAKVNFEIDKYSDSFKAAIRLKRDSVIWISATYFNMEVARFVFTPDTLRMIDRRNQQYYVGDYSFLLDRYEVPFNFKALQSILVGNVFNLSDCEKTRIHNSRGRYILSGLKSVARRDSLPDLMQVFASWVDGETYRLHRLRIYEYKGKRSFSADFDDFRDVEGASIPHHIVYELAGDKKMEFISEYLRIVTAPGQTYPFSIDAKYEPIRLP
jgi:hypothetical protein